MILGKINLINVYRCIFCLNQTFSDILAFQDIVFVCNTLKIIGLDLLVTLLLLAILMY